MHPAYSVIVFTTASGAGYGLLIVLAFMVAFGLVPRDPWLGFVGLGLALALITAGLLSSTAHLGRPERAWRAFSQWRSSWLSREGVASLATYVPAAVLGLGWVFGEAVPGQITASALLTIPLALATLWCTGMIYASLPTIRAWYQPSVAPIYEVLGLATGSILLAALLACSGHDPSWPAACAVLMLAAGWLMKSRYWSAIDNTKPIASAETATGLGRFGTVRPLDPPHTQPNFVMREMGYQVARRHAVRLRLLASVLLFAAPVVAMLLVLLDLGNAAKIALSLLAVVSAAAGVLTERWLFFAEAEHVVTVYYRGGAA